MKRPLLHGIARTARQPPPPARAHQEPSTIMPVVPQKPMTLISSVLQGRHTSTKGA